MINVTVHRSGILEAPDAKDWNKVRKGKFVEVQLNLHWISLAFVFTYWSETE